MRGRFWESLVINFTKRQVVANRYLSVLGHSISALSYFQVDEECGNHFALIFNGLMPV